MGFERDRLPDVRSYYESEGLKLTKGNKWVTTACHFHEGSDSMRINLHSGAFVCMAGCGARGGDVLAITWPRIAWLRRSGKGAWLLDRGRHSPPTKPAPLPSPSLGSAHGRGQSHRNCSRKYSLWRGSVSSGQRPRSTGCWPHYKNLGGVLLNARMNNALAAVDADLAANPKPLWPDLPIASDLPSAPAFEAEALLPLQLAEFVKDEADRMCAALTFSGRCPDRCYWCGDRHEMRHQAQAPR